MDLRQLPKVELHLHLDCSLSYAVVSRIDPSISLATYQSDFIAPARCTDLADFLTRAPKAIALMQTEEQLRLVTRDVFEQLARDNVLYAEVRFAPLFHTEKGLSPREVVGIVAAAADEAVKATGVEARLILCTLRHFDQAQSLDTVRLVEAFRGTRVAGFDIAGDEAGFPIDAHVAAFHYARDRGIPCTAHAGEAAGAPSVWATLDNFHPARIGHGVRSSEDAALLDYLRARNIHLEVCPTSNLQTNMYAEYADHPIDRLYNDGLSVGVNTDARTITNITLTQEYEKLHQTFGWEADHFLRCNTNALQAAFIAEDVRQELLRRLAAGYVVAN
ncbi:MAG: adenosine deaminase [Anaerolineae bacterium]